MGSSLVAIRTGTSLAIENGQINPDKRIKVITMEARFIKSSLSEDDIAAFESYINALKSRDSQRLAELRSIGAERIVVNMFVRVRGRFNKQGDTLSIEI
jgi:hypothetical protein